MEGNKKGGFGHRSTGRSGYGRRDDNRRSGRSFNGENKSFGDRHSSERSFGEGRPTRDRKFGDRKFGDRKFGDRKFGDRKFEDRKPFRNDEGGFNDGDRPRQFSERPFGDRRESGERRSFGDRRQGGDRRFGERRFGERKSFGDRKQGGFRKPYFKNDEESGINKMINRKPQLDAIQNSDNDQVKAPVKEEIRLNKFIANSGVCSRREADDLILAGVVTVNGEVVTELGTKVNIYTDDVRFNGERLKGEEKVYIIMNKPKGYVTTVSDPHAGKTVMDLIKKCPARVFPVGRLDKNTTGILMFTNDGEIAEKLTHPSYDKKKIYQVTLDNKLKKEDYDKILQGILLPDGEIAADELEYIDENDHRKLGIEIHSGKNRIVRRIFESLGYDVRALDRVYFAGLTKKGLKRGEWRYLSEGETNLLKMGAYL